jgi:signal transduction histidine kinase
MKIINDFNLKKQAEDMEVKVWQTPGFLFIVMGIVAVIIMAVTYFISLSYDDIRVFILAECALTVVIISAGTLVARIFNHIANLNKIKNEFVAVASHQLRTPLSAIRWETELLLGKFKKGLNQKQLKNIESISDLSRRMTRLVNDLLDVARIDQKRLIIKKHNFNLKEVIDKVLDELTPLIKSKNIHLSVDFEKNLPLAIGDAEKISLALDNLINNAVKYTVSGGKIGIKLFRKNDNLIFEVKDNGVGIPEEQMGRVFEKFFRSDNAVKYQTEGTGLGLYIAKNIIEQMGGEIWFQSIENVGSIFNFSLPCINCEEEEKN